MAQPFTTLTGKAVPFGLRNVDTDVIIPSQYLKVVSRFGLGKGAFETLRRDPGNVFDSDRYRRAPILIAGDNFGCGSSREHAAWALADMGFRAIIAPSFADIFAGNAFKNGILLVTLSAEVVELLLAAATSEDITVDLERQLVCTDSGSRFLFEIDAFRRRCLLDGVDEIDLVQAMEAAIQAYEARLRAERSWAVQLRN